MNGVLAEGVLPGLLRDLYVGRRSGTLHVRSGAERRSVVFRHGHIVHADTDVAGEHLGDILVRRGFLGSDEAESAVEAAVGQGRRLGDVLREQGLIDRDQLEDALAGHVHEVLTQVFALAAGTYDFEDAPGDAPESDTTLRLSTGDMILEAARLVKDPALVRYALGDAQGVLAPSTDPLLRFQRITLDPTDGYILSRVDGTLSMEEVVQLSPVGREETERSLFLLLCVGVIEPMGLRKAPAPPAPRRAAPAAEARAPEGPAAKPEPEAPAAPAPPASAQDVAARRREIEDAFAALSTKNHFEVMGIVPGATAAQVKEAYFRLAKRFHPDAHHDRSLSDLRSKLEVVFIRLGQAYETLRNPKTRGPYEAGVLARMPRAPEPVPEPESPPPPVDPAQEARRAKAALREAARHFEAGHFWDVIQLLEDALPLLKGTPRQQATLLLARATEKNPNWVKRAEELLLELLHESPQSLDAHLELARIYQGQGMRARAAATYRKVLELSPGHEEAMVFLDTVAPAESPAPEKSGGLLRRLFGRNSKEGR